MLSFGGQVAYRNQSERRNGAADYDYLFKVVVVGTIRHPPHFLRSLHLGDSRIGKSSFLMRFADNHFYAERYVSTIGCDFKVRSLEVGGVYVKLQLWDTAGQERFRSITSSYYRGAQALLLMYDVTNRQSFENIPQWHNEMRRSASEKATVFLVGLKADLSLERTVSTDEGKAMAARYGVPFWEVSAKLEINVTQCMLQLCAVLCQSRGHENLSTDKALFDVHKKVADIALSEREDFDDDELAERLESLQKEAKGARKKPADANAVRRQAAKADPNVLRIGLADLGKDAGLVTGDPFLCRRCGSAFSALSKVEQLTPAEAARRTAAAPLADDFTPAPAIHPRLEKRSANARREEAAPAPAAAAAARGPYWCCEFCGAANEAALDEGEIPRVNTVDYLLQVHIHTPQHREMRTRIPCAL